MKKNCGLMGFGFVLLLIASLSHAQTPQEKTDVKKQANVPKRLQSSALIRERLSYSLGAYFSQGDYGTDKDTDILSIPLSASYSRGPWRISGHMPYLHISGPASVIAISDGAEVVDKIAEGERERWGNGDLRLTTQYQFFKASRRSSGSHVGVSIKVPIASEEAELGSGEFDYSVFVGGYLRSGKWVSNARIGYQLMGDTDETDYNNRLYASLGGRYLLDRRLSLGVSAYYKQEALDTSDAINTLSSNLTIKMQDGWRMGLSLGTGLTDASAELFGGIQFTKSFVRKRRVVHEID